MRTVPSSRSLVFLAAVAATVVISSCSSGGPGQADAGEDPMDSGVAGADVGAQTADAAPASPDAASSQADAGPAVDAGPGGADAASAPVPALVKSFAIDSTAITCLVTTAGELWCNQKLSNVWKMARHGADTDWERVYRWSIGSACAQKTDGTLWCWGSNMGWTGSQAQTLDTPTKLWPETDWTDWARGSVLRCGLRAGGELYCMATDLTQHRVGTDLWKQIEWDGNDGLLGLRSDGTLWRIRKTSDWVVEPQVGTDSDWAEVTGGRYHCLKKTNGTIWCSDWNDLNGAVAPAQASTETDWTSFWGSSKTGFTGVRSNGALYTVAGGVATQVGTRTDWKSVMVSGHTCAQRTDGSLWCWGSINVQGELGAGVTTAQQALASNSDTAFLLP